VEHLKGALLLRRGLGSKSYCKLKMLSGCKLFNLMLCSIGNISKQFLTITCILILTNLCSNKLKKLTSYMRPRLHIWSMINKEKKSNMKPDSVLHSLNILVNLYSTRV
jgi:hypothetical protein